MQEAKAVRTVAWALFCCLPTSSIALLSVDGADDWRSYEVYQPTITPRYNHFPGTRFLIDIQSVQTRVESNDD